MVVLDHPTLRRRSLIYWVWTRKRKPLRVAVFGANSIVTNSKTVTVHLESIDGSVKKCVFLWTTPKICEMTAVDWKLDHLRDLEIEKPVEHGEVTRNFFYHLNIA